MFRHPVERGENALLGPRIERAGRLVQQQDRRVLEERAGDSDALLLAARQFQATLAHFGIEAVG